MIPITRAKKNMATIMFEKSPTFSSNKRQAKRRYRTNDKYKNGHRKNIKYL